MSDFWIGVLTVPIVLLCAAVVVALGGLLLSVWFNYGADLLKILPVRLNRNSRRANHAAVLAVADRAARLFWVAGFSVYVVQHGPLGDRSTLNQISHDVETALNKLREP